MEGSAWRKWDLHFHTPSSFDYQNKSVSNQEIVDTLVNKGIAVIAITDHHIMDVARIKDLQALGKDKLTVLPGIEFRAELGGSESIHFIGIFSEKCDLDDVWKKLQVKCELTDNDITKKGGSEKIYCDLKDTCDLIHELGGLVTVHAGGKTNTLESIKNNQEYKKALKIDLVSNYLDIFELGREDDQEDYNGIVFPAIGFRRPMIICSDNHNIKNYTVKQNLWIKADPTFEGLRQIIFEPQFRVHIGEYPPIKPPVRINKVTLDFPSNSTFENELFCLSGKREINFSPNFTCLIGGRGTGKSTILNLIHAKLRPGENQFFKEKKIKDSTGKLISIEECVSIDNDSDEKFIEFLSQNEVEEFAQEYTKLTAAIYSRILKKDEDGLIIKNEAILKEKLELFKLHIIYMRKIASLKSELEQKEKELGTNIKIVDSFTSDEYVRISNELKAISSELNNIRNSSVKYVHFTSQLRLLIDSNKEEAPTNPFSQEIAKIVNEIEKLLTAARAIDFSGIEKKMVELEAKFAAKKEELKAYLASKGLTEENLQDISNANIIISNLESEIQKKKEEIESMQKKIDAFDKAAIITASVSYKEELDRQIKNISSVLEKLESEMLKPISLKLEFDTDEAHEKIFRDFLLIFEGAIAKNNHRYKGENILREILFCVKPPQVDGKTKEQFLEDIRNHSSTSGAKNFLLEMFSDDNSFEVYKLTCERNLLNFSEFKRVRVYYDTRPIESSSFGQRCTAVLVILLLLGNNPIIIDEPEAHLDSLLISNYLVEVIKNKKQGRQIIFATHNANFVINGDSELIHILDTENAAGLTNIVSTTIENEATKETLISLEGGKDAFLKRENKYQVN